MTKETKLGIAFIGILLTVFTGLLIKKLTRPSNRGLNNPSAQAVNDLAATQRAAQSTPPTTLTPKSEASKPSLLTALDDKSNAGSASPWKPSNSYDSAGSTTSAPKPTVTGERTVSSLGDLGSVRYGPVFLSGTYRIPRWRSWQPYVGAGAVYAIILHDQDRAVSDLIVLNNWGVALQAGVAGVRFRQTVSDR